MTALVPEAPPPKKIHIPQKEIDEFFRKNSEGLNSEAKQLFSNMGAEDQRRVLNSGPLNIFKSPMDMYKFRVAISRDREQEIADRKGGEFVAKEAQDYEVKDWIKSNETYLGEEGAKQLDMFGAADQWRIISEGPASESMDPVHIIQTRAKRSRELANTVSVMFAQRREMANEKAEAKAAPKRLFKPELADTVQAFFTRVVGCEVPASQRRTGGFGVQHQLEEDRSKLVGKVKGVDGVVEVLKNKYECLKGERYRVIGERGGPAGMWRLEGGKTIPKTHVKEGGWKWVLEEPEPEAKLAKPPPVATAPVETFVPKELRQEGHEKPQDKAPMPEEKKKQNKKKSESESEESSEDSASEERSESPKKKKVLVKRKVKTVVVKKVVSGDDAKAKRKKRVVSKHQAESESDQEAPKKRRARGRAAADSRDDSREPPAKSKGRGSKRRSQQ
ncbi:unnamed protein product, partial [Effrenium voratum]